MMIDNFRPSSLPRIALCPASHNLSKRVKSYSSDDATRGRKLHHVCEGFAIGSESLLKALIKRYELSDDEFDLCKGCFNTARDMSQLHCGESGVSYYPELSMASTSLEIKGTPDFVAHVDGSHSIALLADYKFGYMPVNAPEYNLQLKAYALLVHEVFGVEQVVSIVIQPESTKADDPIAFSNFDEIRDELSAVIEKAKTNIDDFQVGKTQCQFCPSVHNCPAVKGAIDESLLFAERELSDVSGDDLYNILVSQGILFKLDKKAKTELTTRLLNEEVIDGVSLREGRLTKTITNISAVYSFFVDGGLLADKAFLDLVKISIADLSKAFYNQHKGSYTQQAAREYVEGELVRLGCITEELGEVGVRVSGKEKESSDG